MSTGEDTLVHNYRHAQQIVKSLQAISKLKILLDSNPLRLCVKQFVLAGGAERKPQRTAQGFEAVS